MKYILLTATRDVIPIPTIGLRSSVSLFTTDAQRKAAREGLESLNLEAADPHRTSQRLGQTLHVLQQLLRSENLTEM